MSIVTPRSTLGCFILALAAAQTGFAQKWEIGGAGGYGSYVNPSISTPNTSVQAGFPDKGAIGVVFADDMYRYVGGEIRYLFQFGGPQLSAGGVEASRTGHTNIITYDLLVHLRPRPEKLRPFFAGGAGIKVYTGTGPDWDQPALGSVRLRAETAVEPAISAGAGLKYRFTKHAQARVEFRTYFSPLPREIFRASGFSNVHGWVYDFVPMLGISYVFGGE